MKSATIKQLNRLNQDFYQKFANEFAQSRSYYWSGWQQLLPLIKSLAGQNKNVLKVGDFGCGNGRFGNFLVEGLSDISLEYLGYDSSAELLKLAYQSPNFSYQQIDLVERLLNHQHLVDSTQKFDLIVLFGVLHHLPSFQLRQKLIEQLLKLLAPSGRLVLSLWRFTQLDRLQKKIVPAQIAGINPDQLEPDDYILDWNKGGRGYRYCHFTSQEELEKLVTNRGHQIENSFLADAKEQLANQYVIIRP